MRRTIVFLSASLLTLAACTPTNNGNPSAASDTLSHGTTPSSPDEAPAAGVPRVEKPIDIAHFQQVPCDALTTSQVTEFLGTGITPEADASGTAGPQCRWNSPGVSQAGIGVIFTKVDNRGITRIYEGKGTSYPFFKPLEPIDGYPLVAYDGAGDQTSKGRCTVALGTSDHQTADIDVAQSEQNMGKKDPCAAAREVASKVLENLRKGK